MAGLVGQWELTELVVTLDSELKRKELSFFHKKVSDDISVGIHKRGQAQIEPKIGSSLQLFILNLS